MEIRIIDESDEETMDFGDDCSECNGHNNATFIILFGTDYNTGIPICEKCLKYINKMWIEKEKHSYAFDKTIRELLSFY